MPCRLMAARPPPLPVTRETSRVVAMPSRKVARTTMPKPSIRAGSSTAATGVRARVPKNSTGRAK
jgi:hypothetical protein